MPPKFKPTRERKHRRRQDDKVQTVPDSNAAQLVAPSTAEREEKRRKLKEQLRESLPKISGKKQKRLDKYIENKLKKDENLELLKKLSQSTFDTSTLQSSRHLKRKHEQYAADLPTQAARNGLNEVGPGDSESEFSSDDDVDTPARGGQESSTTSALKPAFSDRTSPPTTNQVAIGSGLRQPLALGPDGLPVLKPRERKKRVQQVTQELPWEGFSSVSDDEDDEFDASASEATSESSDMGEEERDDERSETSDVSEEHSGEDESEDDDDELGSGDSEEDESEAQEAPSKPKVRQSAFKSWATQQINESLGFTPSTTVTESITQALQSGNGNREIYKNKINKIEVPILDGTSTRKAFSVPVNRSTETQEARMKLPIVAEEQKIMEAIYNNPSVIVWGATGSGKTTQIPQFLFEAGYGSKDSRTPGLIGVTQPRRVAAVSMAKRVADELTDHGKRVAYQIRFESTTSPNTAIKFMTDGILLRGISQDFSLTKYSVIVVDEAHERSVNTDILIGMLSRIVDLRKKMHAENEKIPPLQLIIVSATLRTSDFLQNGNLFRNSAPPLVQAEGRQYPVTTHFSRRTERDYVEEAFRKVTRGHRKLPPGGMLVFLTGQNEIKALHKRLSAALKTGKQEAIDGPKVQISASEAPLEAEDLDVGGFDNEGVEEDDDEIKFVGLDDDEDDADFDIEDGDFTPSSYVHILPLYSQLPTKEQLRVFDPVPEGARMIVLATNVAETSLTIPGIRYVFDSGRSKERVYDPLTGVQSFQIDWISKASAAQRAGRAGRTGPGHCYRLYSSAIYERDFAEFTEPEILRTPLETVVLQLKTMGIDNVLKFPFPTPPDRANLAKAEKLLRNLGALSSEDRVTPLGRSLSIYPLSPRFGKMLAIGSQHGCLPYVIAIVTALAVGDIFIPENQLDMAPVEQTEDEIYTNEDRLEDDAREQKRKAFNRAQALFTKQDRTSDALKMLSAVCAYAYANDADGFCEKMFLRPKALKEATQLREQLSSIVRANHPTILNAYSPRLPEASSTQSKALKQIIAAGFIDQLAIRADLAPNPPEVHRKPRRAIDVPYLTLFPVKLGRTNELAEKAVFIHPTSILARQSPKDLPQFLVYSHLQQAVASSIGGENIPKVRMMPLTGVTAAQISALAHGTPLIQYGKPIGKIQSVGGTPEKRECWVIPSVVGEAGSMGWPLPAKKVVQVKDMKAGWIIEKFVT